MWYGGDGKNERNGKKYEIIPVDSNTQTHYAAVTQSNCITKKSTGGIVHA